jgi:uncharacterized membrane protein (DUF4010 family)
MSRLGAGQLGTDGAANAVAIAVAVNTLSKVGLGWMAGGAETGIRLLMTAIVALAAGMSGYLVSGRL